MRYFDWRYQNWWWIFGLLLVFDSKIYPYGVGYGWGYCIDWGWQTRGYGKYNGISSWGGFRLSGSKRSWGTELDFMVQLGITRLNIDIHVYKPIRIR